MSQAKISFKCTAEESALISQIVDRAAEIHKKHHGADDPTYKFDYTSLNMDVTACHANGNPLKLQDLLDFEDFSFAHDVFGISRHIDRDTGKLLNCFSPRCSAD